LLFGLALTLVVNIVFGLSNSYAALMVFMVLNGLAQATGWSTTVGTLGSWTSRGERGTLMGVWGTCYAIGSAVAAAYAAFWLGRLGWRGAFFAASVVLLVVWLVVYLYQRNRPEDVGLPPVADADEEQVDESNGAAVWPSGLWTTTLLIGTFYFFVKFVRYALDSWTPYLLDTYFGMKPEEAGYVSTLFAVFGPLGVFVAGYLSDRVFNSRRASISFLMILGMVLGCGMLQTLGAVSTFWFGVSIAVIGFMLYGPDSLLTGASAIDLGGKRGALMIAGVINGMGSLGAVAQEYVVPWLLRDGGVSDVFTSLVMASLASMLILGVVLWRNHRGLSDV
jgi:sugar phosphate permease